MLSQKFFNELDIFKTEMYNPGDLCPYLKTNMIYGNILEESKDLFFYSNCKQSLQPEVIQ